MIVDAQTDVVDPAHPYEKILVNQNNSDEDIQCDVCLEFEYEDDDQIVMCDLCNAASHQKCYGGSLMLGIPQGNWYCDRCLLLVQNREMLCTEIKCFLCNDIDGIIKNVDPQNKLWAHVICVNWNPDIYFTDHSRSKIEGQMCKRRFELKCN